MFCIIQYYAVSIDLDLKKSIARFTPFLADGNSDIQTVRKSIILGHIFNLKNREILPQITKSHVFFFFFFLFTVFSSLTHPILKKLGFLREIKPCPLSQKTFFKDFSHFIPPSHNQPGKNLKRGIIQPL